VGIAGGSVGQAESAGDGLVEVVEVGEVVNFQGESSGAEGDASVSGAGVPSGFDGADVLEGREVAEAAEDAAGDLEVIGVEITGDSAVVQPAFRLVKEDDCQRDGEDERGADAAGLEIEVGEQADPDGRNQ